MDCNLNVIDAVERTLVDIRNDTEFIDDLVWEFLQQRFDIGQPNGCPIIRSADIQDASLRIGKTANPFQPLVFPNGFVLNNMRFLHHNRRGSYSQM